MKASIITINKNNVEGLRRTITSVIEQSFNDFEYIIIDGNSSDSSVSIINELLSKHSSFPASWISEDDSGIYNAMNKGINMSQGDYLLFLNSGDVLVDKDCLQRVFDHPFDTDIITTRCNVVDNGQVIWTSPHITRITLDTLYSVGIPHQSTFIKKALFNRFGMYREDFRYNSDIAFWYKSIIFGGATTIGLDLVLTNYDNNGISATESKTPRYQAEKQEILSEGGLPRITPDYDRWYEYQKKMREFEWINNAPVIRFILRSIRKVFKIQ